MVALANPLKITAAIKIHGEWRIQAPKKKSQEIT